MQKSSEKSSYVVAPSGSFEQSPRAQEQAVAGEGVLQGIKGSGKADPLQEEASTAARSEDDSLTWKELAPLVAMPAPSNTVITNRLAKQTYSRLGRNLLFEARPAVLHFGSYIPGRAHSQRVRVINISRTSQRLHILGPSTGEFKVRCARKGLIAPGSAQSVIVDFFPREYRYHYDCIGIHTDSDNLLIPVHAYPVMNDVVFPTRLDFGAHALGETVRRRVQMVCKVPIHFEFEIEVVKPHPHFSIRPLKGVVPANGSAEIHVDHTPTTGSSAEAQLLVNVSQFGFKPVLCVVTGAGRPGLVRRAALTSTASHLGCDTLRDSLGSRGPGKGISDNTGTAANAGGSDGCPRVASPSGTSRGVGKFGASPERSRKVPGVHDADMMDTLATRTPEAEHCPYGTGKGSGAVFDVGGEWVTSRRREAGQALRAESWVPPQEGRAFGSLVGPPSTTVVEGLVIPARLDSVQATNYVLTQQPGKLKPKDLKAAIKRTRDERKRRHETEEDLRLHAATEEGFDALEGDLSDDASFDVRSRGPFIGGSYDEDRAWDESTGGMAGVEGRPSRKQQPASLSGKALCAYGRALHAPGGGEGGVATRQLREVSFLHDLASIEAQERERSFKASVEYIGEPLLTRRETVCVLEERRRCQAEGRRRQREVEKASIATSLQGPSEVGARFARASLLLTGTGTQGTGFHHVPDWDIYKNEDWEKRREVLRRLVCLVGKWIIRRRAGRRLAAIQARLHGLHSRAEVIAMVKRDNEKANLAQGPSAAIASACTGCTESAASDGEWSSPSPLVMSFGLADRMLAEAPRSSTCDDGETGRAGTDLRTSSHSGSTPARVFHVSAGHVKRRMFPVYEESATVSRKPQEVDASGPPVTFVDIGLLPLREPEEGRTMGYESVRPPALGTYPSIEKARPFRRSAFEECGVRQPRDEENDSFETSNACTGDGISSKETWRQALSTTERRQSKATLGRRRSSVGLRMTSETAANPEEAWLAEAEAELTALAAEAEKAERMPDCLLHRPPPPHGLDFITPDPRFKAFIPELPMDEASPEWCLRPRPVSREVTVTKGMLLGYSPGCTTLRAYADAPRAHTFWKPSRERMCSGLACMRGQASRGVWQPLRGPSPLGCGQGSASPKHDARATRAARGFRLAPEALVAAASAGDELSDSESDEEDEEEEARRPKLTLAAAREAFDSSAGSAQPGTGVGDDVEGAALRGRGPSVTGFARDEALATWEDTRRRKRERHAEKLVDRMAAIGAEVRNIKHAFVLQTPYHRL